MKRKVVKQDTRNKAFLGAIIGTVSNVIGGAISRRKQRKAQEKAQAQQTELEGYQQAAAMSSAYTNQDYVNEYRNKITLKNGGKVKTNDRIKVAKKFACGGRKKANFGTNLKNSIESAINTTLNVSAFVIIFSVIISIIKSNTFISAAFSFLENLINLPNGIIYNLLLGSVEFTNGAKLISEINLAISLKLSIISFILCFSSLSVIAQVTSIVGKDNPNLKRYISLKFLQGIIGFIITFIASNIILKAVPTFNNSPNYSYYSVINKIFIIIVFLLCTSLLISITFKYLKEKLHSS